ncbi:MAG: hypothetical protein GOVbin2937_9 [Prokaryotic dsDNA virus sp.]|nr:MAG: hypothetical protein GOVbin2937_9 [Prokaryotic dsDNA virus sp.]
MTDLDIIKALQDGDRPTFGIHGRNMEVMGLMSRMEEAGLISTDDASLSQETRRRAIWVAEDRRGEQPASILASLSQSN